MKYIMKSGALYKDAAMVAHLEGTFSDPAKCIFRTDGNVAFRTDIQERNTTKEEAGDVRRKRYVILDCNGRECGEADPEYAAGSDPDVNGWPMCRMPRVDHARFVYNGHTYTLKMPSDRKYVLTDRSGAAAVRVVHRGVCGGWDIEASEKFSPELLCVIFILCRYLEQENEFMIL